MLFARHPIALKHPIADQMANQQPGKRTHGGYLTPFENPKPAYLRPFRIPVYCKAPNISG
jgi:hypothetical protein